jgi:cysteine desulfurase / selenocysteine lyase
MAPTAIKMQRYNITMTSLDLDLRQDFPLTKRVIYMNNGAIAPTPVAVIKAVTNYLLKCADEGPDSQGTSEYTMALLNELRSRVAHLINCDRDEVVLTQSTTEGINMVANGIEWKKGNAIVARGGSHEHFANYFQWLRLAKERGVTLRELAIDRNGFFDIADLERQARGSKLIAMSHALYNTGALMPVEEVGRIARENEALFCIDAAQSAGTVGIDVKKIGCHFMAFPGFKWLCGPNGIGVFYCRKDAAEKIRPPLIGGESATLSGGTLAYAEMPNRLQAGFRNSPGAAGLEAALRYILRLGIDNARAMNLKAAEALRQEISKVQSATLIGPDDEALRTSIVTFTLPKDAGYIVRKLGENNIILAERDIGGRKAVRASPHFFNTEEESASVASEIRRLL